MSKDTGEFIISKSMNLRLPPIFGYISFSQQVWFSQSLSHIVSTHFSWENLYQIQRRGTTSVHWVQWLYPVCVWVCVRVFVCESVCVCACVCVCVYLEVLLV